MHLDRDNLEVTWRAVRAFALVALLAGVLVTAQPAHAADNRVFEIRTYTTHEGKLDDLHARFRDHTNYIFVRHGMTLVGYWTPSDGPESKNTLVYILAYPTMEAREKAWAGFLADPDWKKAFADSKKNGNIVQKVDSKFLNATDYSPLQ
jgi:hypothetical protein